LDNYQRYLPGDLPRRPRLGRGEIAVALKTSNDSLARMNVPSRDEVELLFDEHIATVLDVFAECHPFEVVAALGLIDVVGNPERIQESREVGLVAAAELGAMICASAECARLRRIHDSERSPGPGLLPDAGEAVWLVHDRLIAAVLMSEPDAAQEDDVSERSPFHRFFTQTRVMRNDSFDHQEVALLEVLFTDDRIADRCRASLGFDVLQAIHLANVIGEHYETAYRAFSKSRSRLCSDLQAGMVLDSAIFASGAEIQLDVVEAFLDCFGVTLGTLELPALLTDTDLIRRKPIIRDGEQFVCTVPTNLLRAIRPALEGALKGGTGWQHYQSRRARHVEQRAIQLVRDFLRPDIALSGITFTVGSEQGECDGLLLIDDTALILEVKAGSLRARADIANEDRLTWSIDELITKPAKQLARARSALLAGTTITDRDGHSYTIPFGHIKHIYGIIVTLECLSFAAPMLWQLQDEGDLPADQAPPWLIGLHELESICSILEFPVQLIHFLDAHQRMDSERFVRASDEIDVFMMYLQNGLRFPGLPAAEVEWLMLPSGSDELNEWVLYKQGVRKTVTRRPQQQFPLSMLLETRGRLRELDRRRGAGFLDLSREAIDQALAFEDMDRSGAAPRGLLIDQQASALSRRVRSQ
jgi:hypothetical protein